mmetsp:Transcript_7372/g.18022  ORF Transcript_7372/g.18022 Transcript_7372/m.18022 type:complete len:80 (+) Transcript_7372:225-464(+)
MHRHISGLRATSTVDTWSPYSVHVWSDRQTDRHQRCEKSLRPTPVCVGGGTLADKRNTCDQPPTTATRESKEAIHITYV